jgi:hypothetical protein
MEAEKLNSGNERLIKSIDLALKQNPQLRVRDLASKLGTSKGNV